MPPFRSYNDRLYGPAELERLPFFRTCACSRARSSLIAHAERVTSTPPPRCARRAARAGPRDSPCAKTALTRPTRRPARPTSRRSKRARPHEDLHTPSSQTQLLLGDCALKIKEVVRVSGARYRARNEGSQRPLALRCRVPSYASALGKACVRGLCTRLVYEARCRLLRGSWSRLVSCL